MKLTQIILFAAMIFALSGCGHFKRQQSDGKCAQESCALKKGKCNKESCPLKSQKCGKGKESCPLKAGGCQKGKNYHKGCKGKTSGCNKGQTRLPLVTDKKLISGLPYKNIHGHLNISKQPMASDFAHIKKSGATVIINLHTEKGSDKAGFNSAQAAKKNGLKYVHVPWDSSAAIQKKTVELLNSTIKAQVKSGGVVWLHCSSGNRAAAWFAIHIKGEKGISTDEAIKIAKTAGLTKSDLEKQVRTYLK